MNRRGRNQGTTEILKDILDHLPGDRVSLAFLLKRLRRRSFGGILIMLAVISLIPGVSVLSGLLMVVLGLQIALGFDSPRLPLFLADRDFAVELVRRIGVKALPTIERIEVYIRPRYLVLTASPMLNVLGIVIIGLSLVVMLPLPFSNMPPAMALIILSLALLERDGLALSIGLALSVVALSIGVTVARLAVTAIATLTGTA